MPPSQLTPLLGHEERYRSFGFFFAMTAIRIVNGYPSHSSGSIVAEVSGGTEGALQRRGSVLTVMKRESEA